MFHNELTAPLIVLVSGLLTCLVCRLFGKETL
jgi:hypothetical protein